MIKSIKSFGDRSSVSNIYFIYHEGMKYMGFDLFFFLIKKYRSEMFEQSEVLFGFHGVFFFIRTGE